MKITDKAINEIKRVMSEQNISTDDNLLEVKVTGSACSGMTYLLGFKNKSEIDMLNSTSFSFDELKAVVDTRAVPLLNDITIDFYTGKDQSGFTFGNKNAKSCCGGGCSAC